MSSVAAVGPSAAANVGPTTTSMASPAAAVTSAVTTEPVPGSVAADAIHQESSARARHNWSAQSNGAERQGQRGCPKTEASHQ